MAHTNELPSVPEPLPEPGFYYHYKHDAAGDETTYAYEVLGVGHYTEEERRPEDAFMVIYRPLYETALVYRMGKMCDLRPLGMFIEAVDKPGYQGPRFARITDEALIERLKIKAVKMYG